MHPQKGRGAPAPAIKRSSSSRAGHLAKNTKNTNIAIIGLGYVGLPLALLAARAGYPSVGFDVDKKRIAEIQSKDAAFLSPEERKNLRESFLSVSASATVLAGTDIFIICVPTPVHNDHTPDLEPLEAACRSVGTYLSKGALVIVESTVNPGVCENIAIPVLAHYSGLTVERGFFFAHCPERINPGDSKYSTRTIPRVIGGAGPKSLARGLAFYRSIIDASVRPMRSLKEAEAVKMVENSFRDVNIAFVNELAMSFAKAGIDIVNVIEGASTKPFAFMPHFPGCGVGGHCIPVDPYYLIRYGRENGFEHRFLIAAREINSSMPRYTADILSRALEEIGRPLPYTRIALLGLAYKKDIPDLRESPSLDIAAELSAAGASVQTFDPFVPELSTAKTLDEALRNADAVVLATDHSVFLNELSPETFIRHGIPVFVDGRNCMPRELFLAAGVRYSGIGR